MQQKQHCQQQPHCQAATAATAAAAAISSRPSSSCATLGLRAEPPSRARTHLKGKSTPAGLQSSGLPGCTNTYCRLACWAQEGGTGPDRLFPSCRQVGGVGWSGVGRGRAALLDTLAECTAICGAGNRCCCCGRLASKPGRLTSQRVCSAPSPQRLASVQSQLSGSVPSRPVLLSALQGRRARRAVCVGRREDEHAWDGSAQVGSVTGQHASSTDPPALQQQQSSSSKQSRKQQQDGRSLTACAAPGTSAPGSTGRAVCTAQGG